MARKQSKNLTKLVNETGESIQLVPVSANGHRSPAIPVASQGEYMIRSKRSDTGHMLEVYDGNNNFTNIIITSDDLLKNRELTVTKKAPPPTIRVSSPAMSFEVVKGP